MDPFSRHRSKSSHITAEVISGRQLLCTLGGLVKLQVQVELQAPLIAFCLVLLSLTTVAEAGACTLKLQTAPLSFCLPVFEVEDADETISTLLAFYLVLFIANL